MKVTKSVLIILINEEPFYVLKFYETSKISSKRKFQWRLRESIEPGGPNIKIIFYNSQFRFYFVG